ncbi:hypothetical protein I3760_07G100400 [Carya illinoinensis]|nr:hypothetical protein I3760_07G100400 [Carya illinoinensis]
MRIMPETCEDTRFIQLPHNSNKGSTSTPGNIPRALPILEAIFSIIWFLVRP